MGTIDGEGYGFNHYSRASEYRLKQSAYSAVIRFCCIDIVNDFIVTIHEFMVVHPWNKIQCQVGIVPAALFQ